VVATADLHRRDYFKPDFFNGIAPQLPLAAFDSFGDAPFQPLAVGPHNGEFRWKPTKSPVVQGRGLVHHDALGN
jgi:hypothetical protein